MKKKNSWAKILAEIVVIVIIASIGVVAGENKPNYTKKGELVNVYDCDYKIISLKTEIIANSKDDKFIISGKVLHLITDKLSMTDTEGKEVGKASDKYHLISQDDHEIEVNGAVEYIMEGDFKLFGENYQIYDENKNMIGVLGCNYLNTKHYLVIEDTLIAEFIRTPLMYDFKIKIYTSDKVKEKAALLIICSAYDDVLADRASSASTSKNNNN